MYNTSSNTNPANFLTKVKPATTYLDNPLWEMGPDYMTSDDWSDGRSIKEIKERMLPTAEQNEEIDAEVKKKFKTVHINLSKVESKDEKTNFISLAQVKSNDLLKVQRAILLCIDYLVKTVPKRLLQTDRDVKNDPPDKNCSGGENSRDFLGMFYRKWYVVQKATDEETPDELRNRNVKEITVVKFLCDKTYLTVPKTRIQPFGNTEIDEKRGKRDTDGYAIASITKHGIDADRNGPIPNDPDGTIDTDGTNKQSPGANTTVKDQVVPDETSPRVPLSPREAQEDQDETSYVWAQYNRKYYVGKIVKESKELPEKLQGKLKN